VNFLNGNDRNLQKYDVLALRALKNVFCFLNNCPNQESLEGIAPSTVSLESRALLNGRTCVTSFKAKPLLEALSRECLRLLLLSVLFENKQASTEITRHSNIICLLYWAG
jgi:hypothetical protein